MIKIISVTIRNYPGSSKNKNTIEFDEINKYLEDGWKIRSEQTINSTVSTAFTIVYQLTK